MRHIVWINLGQHEIERLAEYLGPRITEDALTHRIAGFYAAGAIDRDDGILDVVEDVLDLGSGLRERVAGHLLRLGGEHLHGAHDAGTLIIQEVIVLADDADERVKIELAIGAPRLVQLALKDPIHSFRLRSRGGTYSVGADRGGAIALHGFSRSHKGTRHPP